MSLKKPRSDSKLLTLPEEQQMKLADMLMNGMPYHVARDVVAKEFGVEVRGLGAFSSFWDQVCVPHMVRRRNRAVDAAQKFGALTAEENQNLDSAFIAQLKQMGFELTLRPNPDPQEVFFVLGQVLKLRDQELKQQDLSLKRNKFEFSAAEACLKHLPQLRAIAGKSNLDQRSKIDAIRRQLFGTLPEEKPTAA